MYKPQLQNTGYIREIIGSFKGYDNNLVTDDNSFCFTENTSADLFPLLAPRKKRAFFNVSGEGLGGLFSKTKVGYINNGVLYYGGQQVLGLSFPENLGERHFVSMGARLIIFPDKVYVNTADLSDYGYLETTFSGENATLSFCKGDGSLYDGYTISSTAPTEPSDGNLWLDTSGNQHILKQYSEALSMWLELAETFIKVTCPNIGKSFNEGDGVKFSGFSSDLDATHVIRDVGDDYIVISGVIDNTIDIDAPFTVKREIPEMDYICESGNRLWGCNSEKNEIYASKLGDMCNFNVYRGLSTDSYAATVGTDGVFTGAVSYRGFVLFFKENCVHKIYGSNPPYTITTSYLRGVQKGSEKSLVQLNETLYYKSPNGICAYEGGVPVCISEKLGTTYYKKAVGGALNNKYYICMSDAYDKRHLFSYDEEKMLWHKEDNINIKEFATNNSNLYFLCEKEGVKKIGLIDGENVYGNFTGSLQGFSLEDDFIWTAETGLWGLELPESKYYSSLTVRAIGEKGSKLSMDFEYNSSGKWENKYEKSFGKTGSVNVPFISPRCDHLRVRFRGEGNIKLISVSRKVESGSELNV